MITSLLNKRITRRKAYILITLITVLLCLATYYTIERRTWADSKNLYEYRLDNLQTLLKEYPESDKLPAEIALTKYLNGDINKSVEMLRDILDKEPGNNRATLYLGLILSEQREYEDATKLLTAYVQRNQGENGIACLFLGQNYLVTGKYAEALKYLKEAAARDPGNPVICYNIGQVYEKLKDNNEAVKAYVRALNLSPNYTEADQALKALIREKG